MYVEEKKRQATDFRENECFCGRSEGSTAKKMIGWKSAWEPRKGQQPFRPTAKGFETAPHVEAVVDLCSTNDLVLMGGTMKDLKERLCN